MAGVRDKFISAFVKVLPAEDTYFVSVKKPKVKITRDLIELNYLNLSIYDYNDTDFVYTFDKDNLYIWFFKKHIRQKRKILIPFTYLIYKRFRNKDCILSIETAKGIVYIVIKRGMIQSQLLVEKKEENKKTELLIMKKYGIASSPLLFSEFEYTIEFEDIIKFIELDFIKPKNLLLMSFEFLKLPLISFFLTVSLWDMFYYFNIKNELNRAKTELIKLKKLNRDIKNKFSYMETSAQFFNYFKRSELIYPDTLHILDKVAYVVSKRKGLIINLSLSNGNLSLSIKDNASTPIVDDFLKTGIFSSVTVAGVSTVRNGEIINLSMMLKKND